MKILFEVPDKSVDLARFALISACDTEEQERILEQFCEKVKKMKEPIVLDPEKVFDTEKKRQLKELNVAMAIIAIGSLALEEEKGNGHTTTI